jgi:hypothetical protein
VIDEQANKEAFLIHFLPLKSNRDEWFEVQTHSAMIAPAYQKSGAVSKTFT